MKRSKLKTVFWALVAFAVNAHAQIPVEMMLGSKKATADVMFFKYFKKDSGTYSRWLFFSRNRAAIDYNTSTYPPQFGLTQALSYNAPQLAGWAPVLVGQALSGGVYAKAGVQYAYTKNNLVIFSWLVIETKPKPTLDYFLLARYTPAISPTLKLFIQLESINTLHTYTNGSNTYTQRYRLGVQYRHFQFGPAADYTQLATHPPRSTSNLGIFLRHEF